MMIMMIMRTVCNNLLIPIYYYCFLGPRMLSGVNSETGPEYLLDKQS